MHELLLFGQVPSSRHEQVLSILAGIAAMQPQPFLEKHLIFKPARLPPGPRPGHTGAVQGVPNPQIQAIQAQTQGDNFYLQLVAEVDITTASREQGQGNGNLVLGGNGTTKNGNPLNHNAEPITATSEKTEDPENSSEKWTLQFRDLPEVAGRRPVTSRLIYDFELTSGDPFAFLSALDYTHISTYLISGHRLSHISTSLVLFRPHVPLPASSSSVHPSSQPPSSQQTTLAHSHLLDPSGAYILQVALRVSDSTKPELMTRGITELLALKDSLKGVVEMAVAERLSLDTRSR